MTDDLKKQAAAALSMHRAEREHFGETLMRALMDAMPWGLTVDLGHGQTATLAPLSKEPYRAPIFAPDTPMLDIATGTAVPVGYQGWAFGFDWKLTNCDQDHIEVTAKITGGGGSA